MYYLIGVNGFISKNIYLYLKLQKQTVVCLHHNNISVLSDMKSTDMIINCCGINRTDNVDDFYNANVIFISTIIDILTVNKIVPIIIHISSIIASYENTTHVNYKKSKIMGENLLLLYAPHTTLIIRATNIYGYNSKPYYNNILISLMYDKLFNNKKITYIDKNTTLNLLSIDGFIEKVFELINNNITGIVCVSSICNITLEKLINIIYDNNVPSYIDIKTNESNYFGINSINNFQVNENIEHKIKLLEKQILDYVKLSENIQLVNLDTNTTVRGNMVEISNLESKRLYEITLNTHSIRGNHYHSKQIEDFYVSSGTVCFLLYHKDNPDTILHFIAKPGNKIRVLPDIVHTLTNDYKNNIPKIFILSTQKYIHNCTPDTEYVKFL
jgi:hypothetical protein